MRVLRLSFGYLFTTLLSALGAVLSFFIEWKRDWKLQTAEVSECVVWHYHPVCLGSLLGQSSPKNSGWHPSDASAA